MQCRSCGKPLQPGAAACTSCGTPVPSDAFDFSSYEFSGDSVPYYSQAQFVETSSVSSNQQAPANPQPFPPTQQYTSPPYYTGVPPFSGDTFQQLPGAIQEPPAIQQRRGGLSGAMIALLIILVLLITVGGGLTYYALTLRFAHQHSRVTAVSPTVSTTKISTNAQNTTPITTTNPQDLYVQATSGAPTLVDPLNSQNPNGWRALSGNCTFTGNVLHTTAGPSGSTRTVSGCVAVSTNFDNFAYQVKATIAKGQIGGLVFRVGSGMYLFAISSEGVYLLVAAGNANGFANDSMKVLAGANSSAINTGLNQLNLLTVIARGSTIYLYINKQYMISVSDSASSAGAIGVFGEDLKGGPVDVAFSEIQVWKL